MKPVHLLDSAILIDHLRGFVSATAWLGRLRPGEAVISVITRAEVLSGGTPDETAAAYELCEQFDCLPLTKGIADRAAELRRTRRWRLPDAFQAALALEHDLSLATRNIKDFSKDRDPFVLVPYEL
ncbi:MAG: type II toxin-antitoxin system VapC family toxin [Candidatus Aminicenantes bacterium]|nr:type II toxin-antitoxin system VapC family toxin [Candidatus Aminicenantes bacterium]